MKLWNWLKALPIFALIGAALAAAMWAWLSVRSGQKTRRAENAEAVAENIIQDHTKKSLNKAVKLRKQADADKQKAADIIAKAEAKMAEVGAKDETMADIAKRFNGRVVRQSTDGAT